MKVTNVKLCGIITESNDNCTITHVMIGKYQGLIYNYGLTMRLIKYATYFELITDLKKRLNYLTNAKSSRYFTNTPYGDECIKNWYKFAFTHL